MMRIAIVGASGRMGRMLIEAVLDAGDAELSGAVDVAASPALGRDAGDALGRRTGVAITDDVAGALRNSRFLIDFTRPEGTLAHLRACTAAGVGMVIGTTGFDADGKRAIEQAAETIPIVFAPNMSVGVNVTFKLLEVAAKILNTGYDIEIIEAHHRHKVDAPSGTAILLGRAAAAGRNVALDAVRAIDRDGRRQEGAIGFASLRGGDVVGDHSVILAGAGERIELTHRASDRGLFARGALRAALWTRGRKPGLYDMTDVLGL